MVLLQSPPTTSSWVYEGTLELFDEGDHDGDPRRMAL